MQTQSSTIYTAGSIIFYCENVIYFYMAATKDHFHYELICQLFS